MLSIPPLPSLPDIFSLGLMLQGSSALSFISVATPLLLMGGGVLFLLGAALGYVAQDMFAGGGKKGKNKPKWPRDWPKPVFTGDPDPTQPGYMKLTPTQAKGSGAMPLGRTYPRMSVFPNKFPFRELRRSVEFMTSQPVWVPYQKRFQHAAVAGGTGRGKSTSFAIPILAYGALERKPHGLVDTAYFAIDVKDPAFLRMFADLYRRSGKDVIYFGPWNPEETLGFEPIWRANDERKDIVADVIATYTMEAGQMQSSENSEFFKIAAIRLMRGMIDLSQYWPRRYCNLPAIQQLVAGGGNVISEAFQKAEALVPSLNELLAAVETVLPLTEEQLRGPGRAAQIEGALGVLDRSGYRTAFTLKRMRRFEEEYKQGKYTDDQMREIRKAFWAQIKHEWLERRQEMEALIMRQGEFIKAPEDTRNSIVSTLVNKVGWFRDPTLARAFSRDEVDIRTLIESPCLFLVGSPMAKLKVGSLFVAGLMTNLAINAVFQRGMAIEQRVKGVSKHGIFFLLDEFPQLNVKSAPSVLATFRGFVSGLFMVFQERSQMRQLYGEDAVTMDGNTSHMVLLGGSTADTAEYYATKVIGDAQIVKESKSGVQGEKENVSKSLETVPLMSTSDVRFGVLNGKVKPGLAISVGQDQPAFPMRPLPFYEDPTLRHLLQLKHTLKKKDPLTGQNTWCFWKWEERWEPTTESPPYIVRRKQLTPAEREAGLDDPVYKRLQDPYTQYLDYVLSYRGPRDELYAPQLNLRDIGVTENDPRAAALAAAGAALHHPGPGGGGGGAPDVEPTLIVPAYSQDFRQLINDDFQGRGPLRDRAPMGGSLDARLDAYETDFLG